MIDLRRADPQHVKDDLGVARIVFIPARQGFHHLPSLSGHNDELGSGDLSIIMQLCGMKRQTISREIHQLVADASDRRKGFGRL